MSVVEARHVTKRYGEVRALDDVSLVFPEGNFFALLGPSGSGKTTLLRAVAGFVEPEAGEILLDGQDIAHTPVHRRNIGMVFQNYALFPHMSVFDNIAFGLSVRGVSRAEARERVHRMLDLVRLPGMEERKPRQLSGGQQQRVALARAMVTEPKVLLLDEPLGALDKRLRQEMQIELKQIQRAVGITAIFVTHDQEEALTLSDHIAIINDGRLVQVGAPHDIYENPGSVFAAGFLGDANILRGRVENGAVAVDGVGPVTPRSALPGQGSPAVVAVRPEKVRILAEPSGQACNRVAGRVIQGVFSGTSVTYIVETAAGVQRAFRQNAGERIHGAGEGVVLEWSPEHTVVVEE
ncbi:MAG: ABC transporter ATP-binding protein [Proteobacteria bacterium]|nr:ABC transporter ATP-binding protein [Pseudomonadota bacterium]MDA1073010.1 ABC transporter ATP-binding protein [Pseudomonadota bacterium]